MNDSPSPRDQAIVGTDDAPWAQTIGFRSGDACRRQLGWLVSLVKDPKQAARLRQTFVELLTALRDPDLAVDHLSRFVGASDDPSAVLALFDRDHGSLESLLRLFVISPSFASRLIAAPETFELLLSGGNSQTPRLLMIDRLNAELETAEHPKRAALIIRQFFNTEVMRVAYQEFVGDLSPEKVGHRLAQVNDTVIEAALQFTLGRLADKRGMPERPDGTVPEVTVIGLGDLGGEETGYGSPLKLIFLFDSIDHRNIWHRDFYETLVKEIISLLCGDQATNEWIDIDLREGPQFEVGVPICSFREAAQIFEASGRAWQRMKFVKARVVAGSQSLGDAFLDRLKPWVYRQFTAGPELAEIETIQTKLSRRAEGQLELLEPTSHSKHPPQQSTGTSRKSLPIDIVHTPGGRLDIESVVQFLQVVYGGHLPTVRQSNFYDAVAALRHEDCLTEQESKTLIENYARLSRLQHHLALSFDQPGGMLPSRTADRQSLAWHLGIYQQDSQEPDAKRFERLLLRTLAENRELIGRLIADTKLEESQCSEPDVESELVLDPNPDRQTVERIMSVHGLSQPHRAMEHLVALSTENVPFLSPHRSRHAFAAVAPSLLSELAQTPDPDSALAMLVRVTDSLGAKATLWDLLRSHAPTMKLMVRLCASTPYLTGILIDNPGMIDELIDSLLIDHLPSADRLDAHSIEICRGAADIDQTLHGLKNSAHLMIGVRDVLGKGTIESTHAAISDTAEACLRRVIEHELATTTMQVGDPVDDQGNPVDMIAIATGKFGGRQPNYHSDLEVVFLYSAKGVTRRRVGGRRATTSNHQFFNQVARRVLDHINSTGSLGRLYELGSGLNVSEDATLLSVSLDDFLQPFHEGTATLWQRLSLCSARVITGSRLRRNEIQKQVLAALTTTQWKPEMANEIRQRRYRMEQSASLDNLKRGEGGTVDVELIAQMLTLQHVRQTPSIVTPGTIASLELLSDASILSQDDSAKLIANYRTLRRIESNLRLMNTLDRHELPHDTSELSHLAFLLGEADGELVRDKTEVIRKENRRLFDQVFDAASAS